MSELRPCPFCSHKYYYYLSPFDNGVECPKCGETFFPFKEIDRLKAERDAYRFLAAHFYEGQALPEPGKWDLPDEGYMKEVDAQAKRILEGKGQ